MRCPHDKEFPELTTKQADFFRAWEKKRAEKGGEEPTYGEIEGYRYTSACEYVAILRRKGFLDKRVRNFRKSDAEFPDIGERSANVLRFIKKYTAENGVPPALREIQGSSYPGVNYGALESVGRLVDAGYLTKQPNIARGIRLTEKAFPEKIASCLDDLALLNESNEDLCKRIVQSPVPGSRRDSLPELGIPMRLNCPECRELHIDEGEFATKPHHTHACQACGHVWRPAVVPTTGVRFLPGFKTSQGAAAK